MGVDENGYGPLTEAHRQELERGSAISPEVLSRAGVFAIYDAKAAAKLLGKTKAAWEERVPAWVVPYRLPGQRDFVICRGKPARSFELRKVNKEGVESVELQKYAQKNDSGTHLFFGPSLLDERTLNDVGRPIIVSEGEKKTLALESAGYAALGLPGVHQWHKKNERKLHPYFTWITLRGRLIYIAFDQDAMRNADVKAQEEELGRALEAEGAIVRIVRFPASAPKADDFLATHERTEFEALLDDARRRGQLPPDTRGQSDEKWKGFWCKLRLDPRTERPLADVDNIATILCEHPDWQGCLAYDARHDKQRWLKEPPITDFATGRRDIPRDVVDSDAVRIACWFVGQRPLGWNKAPSIAMVENSLMLATERNRFDRVQDYLKGLKWDGTPRLDEAAMRYFGTEDTPYTRTVLAKWMLSAVARARTPGCKADHVLVLEGGQGIGKSTALKILAGGDEFFADTLPEIGTKDALEYCVGPWIIEMAELDHVRKAEVTALKAFVSTPVAKFRAAYGRRTMEYARRCVFAGTTNDSAYLSDGTGNRRFWPVKCGAIDLEGLQAARDQLWAEALHRVRAGEAWHITDHGVQLAAAAEQHARRLFDAFHDDVEGYVTGRHRVTIPELLDELNLSTGSKYDQRVMNRVANVLKELGWVRKRITNGGKRAWAYEPGDVPVSSGEADTGTGVGHGQVIDLFTKVPVVPVVSVENEDKRQGVESGERNPVAVGAEDMAHESRDTSVRPTGPLLGQGDTRDTGTLGQTQLSQDDFTDDEDTWES